MLKITHLGLIISLIFMSACGGSGSDDDSNTDNDSGDLSNTPVAFNFLALEDVALNSLVTSNNISVAGLSGTATISIEGGEYRISGQGFTSDSGEVSNNDTIVVRLTSSSEYSTNTQATLTIGTESAVFSITTITEPGENSPPELTADTSVSVVENSLGVIYKATATDADNDELTFRLIEDEDSSAFEIDANTGELRFSTAPDFEDPSDQDSNNQYQVDIQVIDSANNVDSETITITVLNGLQGQIYASIQPATISGQAAFSNEVEKTLTEGDLTLTWDEPTRALDTSCLTETIDKYLFSYGMITSGQYDEVIELSRDAEGKLSLNCSASSNSSDICSQVVIDNCSCSLPSSPKTDSKCSVDISSCSCEIALPQQS